VHWPSLKLKHSAGSIAPLQLGVVVVVVPVAVVSVVVVVEVVVMQASHITGHRVASGSSVIAFLQYFTSSKAQSFGSAMPLQTGVVVVVVVVVELEVDDVVVVMVVAVMVVAVTEVAVLVVVVLVSVVVGHESHLTGQLSMTVSPTKVLLQSLNGIELQSSGSGSPWQVGVVVVAVVVEVVVVEVVVVEVVVVAVAVVAVFVVAVVVVVDVVSTHASQRTGQFCCNSALVMSL